MENVIAEIYFRLEVDQISHGRTVYNFMDFIGDLGGVPAIMLELAGWAIGSYSAFHASYATMSALYRVKSTEKIFLDSKQNDPNTPELQKMKLGLSTRLFLWTQTTILSFLCSCCKSKKHEQYIEILDKAGEMVEEDFDICEII